MYHISIQTLFDARMFDKIGMLSEMDENLASVTNRIEFETTVRADRYAYFQYKHSQGIGVTKIT